MGVKIASLFVCLCEAEITRWTALPEKEEMTGYLL